MSNFISFFHNPFTKELAFHDLLSHSNTQEVLKLSDKCWREAHYLPTGEIDLRFAPEDNFDEAVYKDWFKHEYPTFAEFFNYALEKTGQTKIYKGSIDLNGLKSIPEGLKLPESIRGGLYLDSLESIPEGLKLPENVEEIDLSSLTSIPEGLKFPENVKWLDLRSLKSIPEGLKLPENIGGWLALCSLTSIPKGLKFPETVESLDLRSLKSIPEGSKLPESVNALDLSSLKSKDRERIKEEYPNAAIY